MWLFAEGHFLIGCVVGFFMTFLDTVDGKLARVTLTSSKWGEVFDHSIDMIHPPFWWWAWWVGLYTVGDLPPGIDAALWIIVGGYVAGRVLERSEEHTSELQSLMRLSYAVLCLK